MKATEKIKKKYGFVTDSEPEQSSIESSKEILRKLAERSNQQSNSYLES